MDAAFRDLIELRQGDTDGESDAYAELTPLDRQGVLWAVEQAEGLAQGHDIIADEDACTISIPGFERPGTMDAVIPEMAMTLDVKSGRKYDYEGQMAAYALGCMEDRGLDQWAVVVLYMDSEDATFYSFTRQQCVKLIRAAQLNYRSGRREINDFCKWCKRFNECPAVSTNVSSALQTDVLTLIEMRRDPSAISVFLRQMAIAKEIEKRIKADCKADGVEIPGYMQTKDAESVSVSPAALEPYINMIGLENLLPLLKDISGKDAEKLLKEAKVELTETEREALFKKTYRAGSIRPGRAKKS